MQSGDLNSGGGGFNSEGLIRQNFGAGLTGSIISLPEVVGKVYRIVLLLGDAEQVGLSLITNGNTIEDQQTLVDMTSPDASAVGDFGVTSFYSVADLSGTSKLYKMIECKSFEITKNAGNTTTVVRLSYEIGSYLQ